MFKLFKSAGAMILVVAFMVLAVPGIAEEIKVKPQDHPLIENEQGGRIDDMRWGLDPWGIMDDETLPYWVRVSLLCAFTFQFEDQSPFPWVDNGAEDGSDVILDGPPDMFPPPIW